MCFLSFVMRLNSKSYSSFLVVHYRHLFHRPLMSVLVFRVRRACKLSIRQIMLLHRYVDSLLGRDGVGLFIVSACSFDF